MKLTPSFVLALAAAAGATASPVLRRQNGGASSATYSLPSSSAVSAFSSSMGSTTSSGYYSPSTTSSSAQSTSTGSYGGMGSGSNSSQFNDTQILQYALTLEHLEATFYNQSLSKLSASDFEQAGYNASVRNQIYSIGRDEASHVDLLSKALGDNSIPACTYNFSSVTDVSSFLATARVLEGVGVSAYLGAAENITNSQYLETAGSILVVEGQHQSYFIAQTDNGGNAIPGAFATPLDFKQVYSLAAPFIESCPDSASLPITAFPSLSLSSDSNNGTFSPGQQVTVSYNATNSNSSSSSSNKYLAIIQGISGPQFVSLSSSSNDNSNNTYQVTLPSNITGGQMYAVVTSSNNAVTDDNTIAGPAVGYVSVSLPQAPDASSSMSNSASSTSSSYYGGGGSPTSSSAYGTATASGSDSIVSTDSMSSTLSASSGSSTMSATQSYPFSIGSFSSASSATPTN